MWRAGTGPGESNGPTSGGAVGLTPPAHDDRPAAAAVDSSAGTVVMRAADFHPDGSELTTADLEGFVRGWNPETGARLREWRVLGGERIDAIAWSPSGEWLLITTADGMRVYRPDGTIEARLDLATRTKAAAWTKDGRMVFAGDRRMYVLPLDTQSWRADPRGLLGAAEAAAGTTLGAIFGIDDKKTSVPASLEGAR